jgi:PAS domain S-box-containing protein
MSLPPPSESPPPTTRAAILDALPANVALLDGRGVILAVNEAWRRFAAANALLEPSACVGQNYLEVCGRATGASAPDARAAAEGIRRVLRGELAEFVLDYPCHSPDEDRWFRLMATPLPPAAGGGAVVMHINITERKRLEQSAQESELHLRSILDSAMDAIVTIDHQGRILEFNPAAERLFGWTRAAALGRELAELIIPPRLRDRHRQGLARCLHAKESVILGRRMELPALRADGTELTVELTVTRPAGMAPPRFTGFLRDITERQRAEAALVAAEAKFRDLVERALVGIYIIQDDRFVYVNPVMTDIFGFPAAELTARPVFDFIAEADRPLARENLRRRLSGEVAAIHYQLRMVRRDGQVIQAEVHGGRSEYHGRPAIIGTLQDITERLRAEAALRASEANMAAAQRIAHFGSWELELANQADLNANPLRWSDEMFRIAGYEPGAVPVTNELFFRLAHPDDHAAIREAVAAAIQSGGQYSLVHRLVRPGGEVRVVHEAAQVFRDAAGRLLKMVGTTHDITERKQAEAEARRTSELLRAMADGTSDAVFVKDAQGRYLLFNEAAARFVGRRVEDVLGRDDAALFDPESARIIAESDRQVMADNAVRIVEEELTAAGVTRTYLATKAPYHDSQGRVIGVIGISRDITERKRRERRLAVFSRLGQQLNTAASPHAAAQVIVAAADELFGWDACVLNAYSPEEDRIKAVLTMDTLDGRKVECPPAYDDAPPAPLTRRVLTQGKLLVLRSEPLRPEPDVLMFGDNRRPSASLMFVPLRHGERSIGLLSVQSYRPQAYTPEDLEVLQSLADHCAGALNRLHTETLHRQSESKFRQLAELNILGILFWGADGQITEANDAFLQMVGYTHEELQRGQIDWRRMTPPEHLPADERALAEIAATGRCMPFEKEYFRKDGSRVPVLIGAAAIEGAADRGICYVADISQRKQAEAKVHEAARLATLRTEMALRLAANAPLPVITREICELLVRHLDLAFARLWTLNEEEQVLELRASAGLYTHLDGPHGRVPVGQFKIGRIARQRQPHLTNDVAHDPEVSDPEWARREGMVAFAGYPLLLGGRLLGVLAMFARHPLSEQVFADLPPLVDSVAQCLQRKADEAALHLSEERFRLVARATSDAIWDWNVKTNKLWWGEGYEKLFGYRRADADPSLKSWTDCIHPDDQQRVTAKFEEMLAGSGADWTDEYRFRCQDGSYAYVLDRGRIVRDKAGRAVRMIGGMTDLSERRRNEEKLREQAALLDQASEAILVKDMAHRIIYWNQGAERIYGWTAEEALGRSARELLHRDLAKHDEALATLLERGDWQGEMTKRTKADRDITVAVRWSLVRDAQGRPKSILAINNDITEKKRLEAQFLRAQRMEGIGTLAGGIAHDLNNVLAPILMSVQVLKLKLSDPDDQDLLDTLESSSRRGAALVKQVLGFARGVEGQRIVVNPVHLMRELIQILRDTFPKNIEIKFTPPRGLWTINGDPTQLHQVLLNLCVNARDAMPDGGSLTVSMENLVIDETYAGMNPDAQPGPFVMIKVADTGGGIPPDIRNKVFEPFFTTKEIGKGTGLGLSTVIAIVKSHGGFINLYSELGKGTRFKVYLPANTTAAAADQVAVEQTGLPHGRGELVLVVDDEEAIRKIAQRTLERFGYRVLLASHGAEAVALYAPRQHEIAAVLTDMAMPIMDGPALILALRSLKPGVKIIASSGLMANSAVAKAVDADVQHFVPKPYTAEALLKTLHEILHGVAKPPPAGP